MSQEIKNSGSLERIHSEYEGYVRLACKHSRGAAAKEISTRSPIALMVQTLPDLKPLQYYGRLYKRDQGLLEKAPCRCRYGLILANIFHERLEKLWVASF